MRPTQNKWLALPKAIQPPAINLKLESLGALSRSAECLRHFILSTEFWISPDGRLRWWLKLNVCIAAWLLIPAVLLMPVISIVLGEVDGCLSILLHIILKLMALGVLITVATLTIKYFPSSSEGSSRRRK